MQVVAHPQHSYSHDEHSYSAGGGGHYRSFDAQNMAYSAHSQ